MCDIVGLKELARPKASKVRKRPVGCFFTSFLRLRGHSVGPHNACTFILRSADTFSCLKVSALALLEAGASLPVLVAMIPAIFMLCIGGVCNKMDA